MLTRRATFAIATVILLVLPMLTPARGVTYPSSNYSLGIDQNTAAVSLSLRVHQNLTLFSGSFTSFPVFHVLLVGSNSSALTGQLQQAVSARVQQASIANPRLEAQTDGWSNSTGLQWYNVTLSFVVSGVSAGERGGVLVNVAWRSFSITSNLSFNGIELNNIGARYLETVATESARMTGNQLLQFAFFANGRDVLPGIFPSTVMNLNLLNFTKFKAPLSSWVSPLDPLSNSRSWMFSVKNLGMGIAQVVTEVQTPERTNYGVFYDISSEIKAPRSAMVRNDSIFIPTESQEVLMGVTVVLLGTMSLAALVYERRITSAPGKGFSKKRPSRR